MPPHLLKRLFGRFVSDSSALPVDRRSRRFVAVIECILNQNARDLGAACCPAINIELLNLCHEHEVGVMQMPCPEIAALGFKRARAPGQSIRAALDTAHGRERCAELAMEVAERIDVYCAEGYELLAVLGGNSRSPGCAVHCVESGHVRLSSELEAELRPESSHALEQESGLFMQALQTEFLRRQWQVPFRAVRDAERAQLDEDLQSIRAILADRSRG